MGRKDGDGGRATALAFRLVSFGFRSVRSGLGLDEHILDERNLTARVVGGGKAAHGWFGLEGVS